MKRVILLFSILFSLSVKGQTELIDIGTTVLESTTLYTSTDLPWELKYGPGDSLWMTTRPGRVYRINTATGGATLLLDHSANTWQVGEAGMLGMAFHPDFLNNPYVFIVYTYTSGGLNRERLSRFTYSGNSLSAELILLDGSQIVASSIHNGSRLVILSDNTILMSTGDASNTANAQNLSSLNGKILRLNLNGTIPADNPFPGSPVYSYGHRNPQGLMQHPNGRIYETEHGPSNNDEFQIIEPGRNYGWPNVEGFCDNDKAGETTFCAANNVKEPLASWLVAPGGTWAPNDLVWYDHPSIPEFQNSFLVTFLKTAKIRRVQVNASGDAITGEQDFFQSKWGRLRDITTSPSGEIFIATNTAPFRIIRLRNSSVVPVNLTGYGIVCDESRHLIKWTTTSEINNKQFHIYAGNNPGSLVPVATIPSNWAEGQSGVLNYEFEIPNSLRRRFYKLVSEDIDGRRYDHQILSVYCERNARLRIEPNPVKGVARIILEGLTKPVNIYITDAGGKRIYKGVKNSSFEIPVSSWSPGIYILKAWDESGGFMQFERLLVQ